MFAIACLHFQKLTAKAAQRLNPGHLTGHWLDPGCVLLQLLSGLISSGWAGSKAFTPEQQLENAFGAYYWMLILVADSTRKRGREWPSVFLPRVTVASFAADMKWSSSLKYFEIYPQVSRLVHEAKHLAMGGCLLAGLGQLNVTS